MAARLKFTKMQGAGNDYVYLNGFVENIPDPHELARQISDRHFGVGSDGLVIVLPSATADIRMRMFNADGTEAEMCGNASRCVAKFAYDNGILKKPVMRLETAAGIRLITLQIEDGLVLGATVDMGEPVLLPSAIPVSLDLASGAQACVGSPLEVQGQLYAVTAVSMGNPHAVVFHDNLPGLNLVELGPAFECHPAFPNRTNTEFVEVLSRSKIRMRVWERGAGETLACGTGACAAVVASVLNGFTDRKVEVELTGGILHVDWDSASNHIYMTGPAVTVFTGEYYLAH